MDINNKPLEEIVDELLKSAEGSSQQILHKKEKEQEEAAKYVKHILDKLEKTRKVKAEQQYTQMMDWKKKVQKTYLKEIKSNCPDCYGTGTFGIMNTPNSVRYPVI